MKALASFGIIMSLIGCDVTGLYPEGGNLVPNVLYIKADETTHHAVSIQLISPSSVYVGYAKTDILMWAARDEYQAGDILLKIPLPYGFTPQTPIFSHEFPAPGWVGLNLNGSSPEWRCILVSKIEKSIITTKLSLTISEEFVVITAILVGKIP